ncbi:MAG: bifunctional phosphoribosylaminoimidazolecarboxamide formyltransferase/IMP cyclohydrolase [Bacteroides sp.]|jgi:phosphoribosylaminoimidazolecarboxamide formyltransferase/IMP cyclohydrolase|nr:bifunctional phosphoribosylaminoimidazolecarboxamide formyltransferase/IMP cyclohydrolase [Bacteroides sp.]
MTEIKQVRRALVSVYYKEPSRRLIEALNQLGVELVSTGGTLEYIHSLGIPAKPVESLTQYPSILGGRVKTLHPAVFGGILARPHLDKDRQQMQEYQIEAFDMVVVDLYPFEETLASGASHQEAIEKIDIGGISLIRAAAKNYQDVMVVPSVKYFDEVVDLLHASQGKTSLEDRRRMAAAAFEVSSHYDTAIFSFMNQDDFHPFKKSIQDSVVLRYGENPHQQGRYFGKLEDLFEQLHGKALSYNNLLDVDAALNLMGEFSKPAFAIIKHTNPCGIATRATLKEAWEDALAGDPVSAFGGILIANRNITPEIAYAINEMFFEVLIAPDFEEGSLPVLMQKKNRILLKQKPYHAGGEQFRSLLGGVLWQTRDRVEAYQEMWQTVTLRQPDERETEDMRFANIIVKHLKSNAIALVKGQKLIGIGCGQTSRVDALKQAIAKATEFAHSLQGAVMASDAFFPFADSVEIAHKAGITAVVQPGGSVRDQASIDYCNQSGVAMIFTGIRHFKH